jgi:hypothetical protein
MAILDDLNSAKEKLAQRMELQELMKKANAVIRKKSLSDKEKAEQLVEMKLLTMAQAMELLQPDYANRKGFPSYRLTNNNAEIKRLKQWVQNLESKRQGELEQEQSGEAPVWEFEGGRMEANFDADRYQIFFDEIPDAEFRSKLKRGWRWSPRYSAWQRKITQNAMYSAKSLLPDLKKVEAAPVIEKEEKVRVADLDRLLGLDESGLKNIFWVSIPTNVMSEFIDKVNDNIEVPKAFWAEWEKRTGQKKPESEITTLPDTIDTFRKDKNFI